jgi:hypothetical protein
MGQSGVFGTQRLRQISLIAAAHCDADDVVVEPAIGPSGKKYAEMGPRGVDVRIGDVTRINNVIHVLQQAAQRLICGGGWKSTPGY